VGENSLTLNTVSNRAPASSLQSSTEQFIMKAMLPGGRVQ
jgi:hypothetical protein